MFCLFVIHVADMGCCGWWFDLSLVLRWWAVVCDGVFVGLGMVCVVVSAGIVVSRDALFFGVPLLPFVLKHVAYQGSLA